MNGTVVCVVCGADVPPDAGACPRCSEPRARLCRCGGTVLIEMRVCPACGSTVGRYLPPSQRRGGRDRRRRLWIAVGTVLAVAVAGAVTWPQVRAAREAAALFREGEEAARAGRPDEAIPRLLDYVRMRPKDARAYHLLAVARFASHDPEGALAEAQTALALDGNSPGTRLLLARWHLAQGDALDALPLAAAAPEPEARAVEARTLVALDRPLAAAEAFARALDAAPSDLLLRLDAAETRARLGDGDWPGAADHRRRAEELRDDVLGRSDAELTAAVSGTPGGRVAWGRALLRAGRAGDAAAALGADPGASAPADVRVERARVLARAAGADRALGELRTALARDAHDVGAGAALVRVLVDAGRAAEGLAVAQDPILSTGARTPAFLAAAADAAAAAGDRRTADRYLRLWRDASPRDVRALRALVALQMPDYVARRRAGLDADGTVRAAATHLEQLAELDWEDPVHLYWRTCAEDADGRTAQADGSLARLLAARPDDAAARALRISRAFAGLGATTADALAAEWLRDGAASLGDARVLVREALRTGHLHVAVEVGSAALLRGDSPDPAVAASLARALLATGRPGAACAILDALPAATRASGEVAALRTLAAALRGDALGASDLAPADAGFERLVAAGAALAVLGRGDDAAAAFARARAACGLDAARLHTLALALEDADRPDDARDTWDAALAAAPGDVTALARGAVVRLARATVDEADRIEAARRIDRLASDPASAVDALALRGLHAAAVSGVDAPAADLRRALAAAPGRADLLLVLARMELRTADPAGAVRDAAAAVRLRPASIPGRALLVDALAARAGTEIAACRVADAVATLRIAAAMAPRAGGPSAGLPDDAVRALPAEAIVRLRRAVTAARADAGLRLALALAEAEAGGEPESAVGAVMEERGDVAAAPLVLVLVRAGGTSPEQATAALSVAEERGAPAAEIAWVRARTLRSGHAEGGAWDRDEAIAALRKGLAADPSHVGCRAELARLLDPGSAEAAALWEGLLADAPDAADVPDLDRIGAALAAAGRVEAARTALLRALAAGLPPDRAEAVRRTLAALR